VIAEGVRRRAPPARGATRPGPRGRSATAAPADHLVLTGAAGAIGAALAHALRLRWPSIALTLIDRDEPGLARVAAAVDGGCATRAVDLADVDGLPAHVDAITAAAGPIDGLVNCAGIMWIRDLTTTSWSAARDLLAIDLLAPLRLQELVVPTMIERRRGVIVNVASMAGRVPLRGAAYYGAAKAGLAMASEIARRDLAPHGVRVVTVYPGPVHSALERGARVQYRGGDSGLARLVPTGHPEPLADRIVDAIDRRAPRVIYPYAPYALGWFASSLVQRFTLRFGPSPAA
jgi:short-subunit dehydrogenase